jgi:hypothetical protein
MGSTLLDYHKQILEKISFADRVVFRKELRKAFKRLLPAERDELKRWFRETCVCRTEEANEALQMQPQPVRRIN